MYELLLAWWARRPRWLRSRHHRCDGPGCRREPEYAVWHSQKVREEIALAWGDPNAAISACSIVCPEHLREMQADPKRYPIHEVIPRSKYGIVAEAA